MSDYLKLIGQLQFIRDYECKTRAEVKTINDVITILSTSTEKTQLSGEDATFDSISRRMAIEAVEFGITYAKAIDANTGESKELFKEGNDALKKAVERLKELPSAEPEIIRCKDCKYYYNTNPESIPTANIICFQMHEDDYCSYAERRG